MCEKCRLRAESGYSGACPEHTRLEAQTVEDWIKAELWWKTQVVAWLERERHQEVITIREHTQGEKRQQKHRYGALQSAGRAVRASDISRDEALAIAELYTQHGKRLGSYNTELLDLAEKLELKPVTIDMTMGHCEYYVSHGQRGLSNAGEEILRAMREVWWDAGATV